MPANTKELPSQEETLENIKRRQDVPFGLLLFRVPASQPLAVDPNGLRLEKTSTQEPTGQTSRDGKVVDNWEPDSDNWKD